jgi:spore maturation protein CgeB
MGCCMVSNPCEGVEAWFEPGKEILVVHSPQEAEATYRELLGDADRRIAIGKAARDRVVAQHTHRHRAGEIVAALTR